MILPILEYASEVLGDKNNTVLMNRLQVLQNKSVKIILKLPSYSSGTYALERLNWSNLYTEKNDETCLYA